MEHMPECYEYYAETKGLKWKKEYERDGPRVLQREFPVVYFDGNKFPDGSPADWVRAEDLQELNVFDASPRLVPNLKFARNYLRRRIEQEAQAASEGSAPLPDTEFRHEALTAAHANQKVESDSKTAPSSCIAGSDSPIIAAPGGMVLLTEELATEPSSQGREVSLSPDMESETSRPNLQLEQANRHCPGNALEPELTSVSGTEKTISFGAGSQMGDRRANCQTTVEGEADHETESSACAARTRNLAGSISIDLNQLVEGSAAEPFFQEREASLSPSLQLEVLSQEPQLDQRDRSCHESASELELRRAPNTEKAIGTDGRSEIADPEAAHISISEVEMSDEGQPTTASELPSVQPANDTMQIDCGYSTRNSDRGTAQGNDLSTSLIHIHQHQIQRALSNHMAADLLNLKTKAIDLNFPKGIQGLEARQPQLPPARPPTAQWHAGNLVPPDNSTTFSCHAIQISSPQNPNDSVTGTETPQLGILRTLQPKPPITDSNSTGGPRVTMRWDAAYRTTYDSRSEVSQRMSRALNPIPPVTAPTSGSQSLSAGAFVPINTEANSSTPPIGQLQATKPQVPQVPTPDIQPANTKIFRRSHLGTLYRSDSATVYLIREPFLVRSPVKPLVKPPVKPPTRPLFPCSIQMQTGEPRFGQPPHEVPPYFLKRLRELTGSRDENPLISKFLIQGRYLCPWCQRKYHRTVSFTDHLVLNHIRSPDRKVVSRSELDSSVDSDIIDLTSES